jgi:hypothetical protein
LERIREERALAQARKEAEERELEKRLREEQAFKSNPLLNLDDKSGKVSKLVVFCLFYNLDVSNDNILLDEATME